MTQPRHLLRPAALRVLPPPVSRRQDLHGAPAPGGARRRNRFLLHDSDHDPRETQTTLRHRGTGEPRTFNFAFENKLQRKFSPLFAKRVPADWQGKMARQLPAYVDPKWVDAFKKVGSRPVSPTFAWRCTAAWGFWTDQGRPLGRPGASGGRRATSRDCFVDVPYWGRSCGRAGRWRVATARRRGFIHHSAPRSLR